MREYSRRDADPVGIVADPVLDRADAEFDLFVKGGFGISSIEHGVGNDTDGIGVTGGVGYDLRIGNNLYVTPNVDGMVHFLQSFTEWSIVVTMGLTWH